MREIKFRGKSIDTGEWVYGYYYNIDDSRKGNRRHIIVYESEEPGLQTIHEPVYRETVGQYTGLKDKNGKEIYEGDIILKTYYSYYQAECTEIFKVTYEGAGFELTRVSGNSFNPPYSEDIEIIGNIHENPELLKGE